MPTTFYTLGVKQIVQETPETVSLLFEIPPSLKETFRYREGQYLTLRKQIDGEEIRRSYSFSSSPLEQDLKITIKQVPNGRMSTYINQELKEGDTLEVMPPMGRFYSDSFPVEGKSYFLFAGGSGITPLFSIAKTVLHANPLNAVWLLYGNQNEDATIFREELQALEQEFGSRFAVQHVLGQVSGETPFQLEPWPGIMDESIIHRFLNRHRPQHLHKEYFVCGPTPMMKAVERILQEKYVPKKTVHLEYFVSNAEANADTIKGKRARLTAHLPDQTVDTWIPEGQTVLDALLNDGYDIPFSCRSGNCATCLGKCHPDQVKMRTNMTLEDDEVAQGMVLPCQAVPVTDAIEIDYTQYNPY